MAYAVNVVSVALTVFLSVFDSSGIAYMEGANISGVFHYAGFLKSRLRPLHPMPDEIHHVSPAAVGSS
jgi:hypothetical protein